MSNSFPSMISNEPPPLNLSSDEEDSEEFRTPGLKLDLSAEPSPLSTPRKVGKPQISNLVQDDYLKPSNTQSQDIDTSSAGDLSLTNGHDEDSNSSSIASKNNNDSPCNDDNPSRVNSPSNIHLKPEPIKSISVSEELSPTPGEDSHNTSSIGSHTEDEFEDCQPPQQLPVPSSLQEQSLHDVESFEDAKGDSKDTEIELEPNSRRQSSEGDEGSGAFSEKKAECDSISIVNSIDPAEKCTETSASVAATLSSFVEESDNVSVESKSSENVIKNSTDLDKSVEFNSEGASSSELPAVDTCIKENDTTATTEFYAASDFEDDDFNDFQNGKFKEPEPAIANKSNSVPNNLNSFEKEFTTNSVLPDDDFSDFDAFQSNFNIANVASTEPVGNISNNDMKTSYIGAAEDEIEDDDFGDFSSMPSVHPHTNSIDSAPFQFASAQNVSAQNDEDDEFADFENFKAAPTSVSQNVQPVLSNNSTFPSLILGPRGSADYSAALESKFESAVKAMIPLDEPNVQSEIEENLSLQNLDKLLQEQRDPYWTHVKDFEESKGLLYKWLNSLCQQKLYKSLKIDTSTIVYTERWGAIEVPRFAASMVDTALLQPQVCASTSKVGDPSEHQDSESRPNMSASDDNHTTSSNIVTGKKPLSKEAQQILQQLPDISFMRAKTLVFPQAAAPSSSLL